MSDLIMLGFCILAVITVVCLMNKEAEDVEDATLKNGESGE